MNPNKYYKNAFYRFLSFYANVKKYFFLVAFCSLLLGVSIGIFPILVTLITEQAVKVFNNETNVNVLMYYILGLIILACLRLFLGWTVSFFSKKYSYIIEVKTREVLLKKFHKLPISFFDQNPSGLYFSRIVTDLQDIPNFSREVPILIIESFSILVVGFTFIFFIQQIVGVAIILVFFVGLLIAFYRKNALIAYRRKVKAASTFLFTELSSQIDGISEIKTFSIQEVQQKKYEKKQKFYLKEWFKTSKEWALFETGGNFVVVFTATLVIVLGAYFVSVGTLDVATLTGLSAASGILVIPFQNFISSYVNFSLSKATLLRYDEFMKWPEEQNKGALVAKNLKGNIEFKNVYFSYIDERGHQIPILKNFNLKINAFEKVMIMGKSGIGKSTLFKLLLRFYNIDKGSITIDDISIYDYEVNSLRSQMGYMYKQTYILNSNFLENIRIGKLDAKDYEVIEAAKKAKIHNAIMQLPNGYFASAGVNGSKLSASAKQRISLARILLEDANIIYFDEILEDLNEFEKINHQFLENNFVKNKTIILISSNHKVLDGINHVIVLDLNNNGILVVKKDITAKEDFNKEFLIKENVNGFKFTTRALK